MNRPHSVTLLIAITTILGLITSCKNDTMMDLTPPPPRAPFELRYQTWDEHDIWVQNQLMGHMQQILHDTLKSFAVYFDRSLPSSSRYVLEYIRFPEPAWYDSVRSAFLISGFQSWPSVINQCGMFPSSYVSIDYRDSTWLQTRSVSSNLFCQNLTYPPEFLTLLARLDSLMRAAISRNDWGALRLTSKITSLAREAQE
jgi:hypothetical protein